MSSEIHNFHPSVVLSSSDQDGSQDVANSSTEFSDEPRRRFNGFFFWLHRALDQTQNIAEATANQLVRLSGKWRFQFATGIACGVLVWLSLWGILRWLSGS